MFTVSIFFANCVTLLKLNGGLLSPFFVTGLPDMSYECRSNGTTNLEFVDLTVFDNVKSNLAQQAHGR